MKVPAVVASAVIGLIVGAGAMLVSLKGLGYMDAPRAGAEQPEPKKGKGRSMPGAGGKAGSKTSKESRGDAAVGGDTSPRANEGGKRKGDVPPGVAKDSP